MSYLDDNREDVKARGSLGGEELFCVFVSSRFSFPRKIKNLASLAGPRSEHP